MDHHISYIFLVGQVQATRAAELHPNTVIAPPRFNSVFLKKLLERAGVVLISAGRLLQQYGQANKLYR